MNTSNNTPTAVRMAWADLLFLHWSVEADALRPHIPEGLELDTFDNRAWIALVPFRMTDCVFKGFSWVPTLRDFYECNVRTYVRHNQTPGVWFFSLDAQHLLPVIGGRAVWKLNYVYSRFDVSESERRFDYALRRRTGPWAPASSRIAWTEGDQLPETHPGSLEHFLTERYWLFTRKRGRVFGGRIRHDPWPLRDATLHSLDDGLVEAEGFPGIASRPPESVLASRRIEVAGEPLRAMDA
ncbi:MAG: DUF2071 domain-containing protein [Planctomycetota bacterium]